MATLIFCLDASVKISHEFESRPALKFLIQKLCNLEKSIINLYKIIVASESAKLQTFYQLLITDNNDEEINQFLMNSIYSSLKINFSNLKRFEKILFQNKFLNFIRNHYNKVIVLKYCLNNFY